MADATGSMLDSWTSGVSDFLQRVGAPEPLPAIWKLAVQGGIFMIPIGICSIVVVAFAIERRMALRKSSIIPRRLLQDLQKLNQESNGIDPRQAYDVCRKYRRRCRESSKRRF